AVDSASGPSEERADHEGNDLVFGRIQAHRFGSYFVIMHRDEAAAISGVHYANDNVNSEDREAEHPEEIGIGRDTCKSQSAADRFNIAENHSNDFAKTQSDDREVITLKPERRNANQKTSYSGHKSASQ